MASIEKKIAKSRAVLKDTDETIERELWAGDQANTKHEERAVRELWRRRLRIAELEAKLEKQDRLMMIYFAIGTQELGHEAFEDAVRQRLAEIEAVK